MELLAAISEYLLGRLFELYSSVCCKLGCKILGFLCARQSIWKEW